MSSPAVRVADRGQSGPTSSPLVLAVVLGLVAVAVGLVVRPRLSGAFGGFGNDAATIQWIMSSPFNASDLGVGSYSVIAGFYDHIGLVDAPVAAAVLGAVIAAAVLGTVIVRVGGVHRNRTALVLALITPLLIGVYEAAYAKEVLISLGMLVIVLMPVNLLGEIVVVATLCALGAEFRTYWLIVAGLYVVTRMILVRRPAGPSARPVRRVVGMVVLLAVLTGLAAWIATGAPADSFRSDANDTVARQANTGSLITRFIGAPEPLGGVLNTTLTSLFFIVPLPMLMKLSPYYLAIGLLFALVWTTALRAGTTAGRGEPLLNRFVALPLAFLVVQGLFEPDWGSALRHATPLLPLIVGAVALAGRHDGSPPPDSPADISDIPVRTRSDTHAAPSPEDAPGPEQNTAQTTAQSPAQNPRRRQRTAMTSGTPARNILADYLRMFRRWWWMIVVGAIVGALVGWGGSALMSKEYTATSQLYVGTASTGGSSDAYQGALLSQKQVGSYAEIAQGRALAQRVVDDLGLDDSAGEVASMITAGAHKDTVILDLKATASDADEARDIANSAAAQLHAMVRELNEQTSSGDGSNAPQLAVLNEAETPSSPSSPNTTMNIALGLVVGLLLGAVAAVVKGLTDRRITDADAVREIVDAPLVGMVGSTDALVERHTLDFAGAPTPAAEQFRELRTNLRFLDVDNAPTVLTVTSGMPGEGKSTLAVNLALALADDGESVCLVDADLRDPSVAAYLGGNLQSAVGLSTTLSGAADVDDVIQDSTTDGLSVITAGAVPPNPAELLGSRRFGEVLARLAARFDHVIVDASPVLPVTDGALVASSADGVLLAARYGATTSEQLSAAAENLTAVNARILGTVFTRTPEAKGRYGGRYGAYGYGAAAAQTAPSAPAAPAVAAAPAVSSAGSATAPAGQDAPVDGDLDPVTVPSDGAHRLDDDR